MSKYAFIKENSHGRKIRSHIISWSALVIVILVSLFSYVYWYSISTAFPLVDQLAGKLGNSITNTTVVGLFYGHFFGGLFFVPSPDEILFYYGLSKGNPILLSLIAALGGYLLAQLLNYWLGLKLSSFVLMLISKKNVYGTHRFVNKYGAAGILVANIIPFPAPLLTFALGIARYNFKRLMMFTIIGKIISYTIIIIGFIIIRGYFA